MVDWGRVGCCLATAAWIAVTKADIDVDVGQTLILLTTSPDRNTVILLCDELCDELHGAMLWVADP